MPSKADEQDMLKRLRELEEENARLRSAVKPSESTKLVVTEGEYKGHPTPGLFNARVPGRQAAGRS